MKIQECREIVMSPDGSIIWEQQPWEQGGDLLIDPLLETDDANRVRSALKGLPELMETTQPIGRGSSGKVYQDGDLAIKVFRCLPKRATYLAELQAGITVADIVNQASPSLGLSHPDLAAVRPLAAVDSFAGNPDSMAVVMPFVEGAKISFNDEDGTYIFEKAGAVLTQLLMATGLKDHIFMDASTRNLLRTAGPIVKIDTGAYPSFGELMSQL